MSKASSSGGVPLSALKHRLQEIRKRLGALEASFPNLKGRRVQTYWQYGRAEEKEYFQLRHEETELLLELSRRGEPATPREDRGRGPDPDIVKRISVIQQNSSLSAKGLCKRLDLACVPIPPSWNNRYGVEDWRSAYKNPKCRGLVDTLISKDKHSKT